MSEVIDWPLLGDIFPDGPGYRPPSRVGGIITPCEETRNIQPLTDGDIGPDIKDRLRLLRSILGESQEDFGARFGRSWKAVSAWENGHSRPKADTLTRTAKRYGWPVDIFKQGAEGPEGRVKRLPEPRSGAESPSDMSEGERALRRAMELGAAWIERKADEYGDRIPVEEAEYALKVVAREIRFWLDHPQEGSA